MNVRILVLICSLCWIAPDAFSQTIPSSEFQAPEGVTYRIANIISEGTRLHAEVYAREGSDGQKLPTIILCHGWGGVAAHLRRDSVAFARAGYLAVSFDYRGWGESDGRVIVTKNASDQNDGKPYQAEVRELRELVDPIDQCTDILNVIHWVQAEPQCDSQRIGLWGSSLGGGHVVYCAARDHRIKSLVSQVPALHGRWSLEGGQARSNTYQQATDRARGNLEYPPPGTSPIENLSGAPIYDKFARYAPVDEVHLAQDCAMLFILAANEELFDNKEHGVLAHERALGKKKIVTVPSITHYGIYREAHPKAIQLAIEWFDETLKVLNQRQ